MKKYVAVILALILIVSSSACNRSQTEEAITSEVSTLTQEPTSVVMSAEPSATPTPRPTTTTIELTTGSTTTIETTTDTTTNSEPTTTKPATDSTTNSDPPATPTPRPTTTAATTTKPPAQETSSVKSTTETTKDTIVGGSNVSYTKQQWLDKLFRLVNEYRLSQGMNSLESASEVAWKAADIRAKEITVALSYTRPNGKAYSSVYEDLNREPMIFAEYVDSCLDDNPEEAFRTILDYAPAKEVLLMNGYNYLAIGYTSIKNQDDLDNPHIVIHMYKTIDIGGSYDSFSKQQWLDELFRLTNEYRVSKGRRSLKKAPDSTWKVADLRAKEIVTQYSHTRPNGKDFYTAYHDLGYATPGSCGENINLNHIGDSAKQVFQEWVDSPGHRENMLKNHYNYLAIGYTSDNGVFSDGKVYNSHFTVQLFH